MEEAKRGVIVVRARAKPPAERWLNLAASARHTPLHWCVPLLVWTTAENREKMPKTERNEGQKEGRTGESKDWTC